MNRNSRLSRRRACEDSLEYAGMYDFVTNASVMNLTQQRGICSRIRDRRVSIFGHVRRLQESVPGHEALHPAVNTRADHRPDDRPDWKRPRGRPRHTSWRSTSGSLQRLLGTWPVIVKSGGRNDPSPVKRSSECVSE